MLNATKLAKAIYNSNLDKLQTQEYTQKPRQKKKKRGG